MGWERMQSTNENRAQRQKREPIRGFMPFTPESNIEGRLEAIRIKEDGKGFFLVRLTKSSIVNVRDVESLTGQGKAEINDLVGIRKVGSTKCLAEFPIGALISVTYNEFGTRTDINPKTGLEETNKYHDISIDVYREEAK